jgi:hypothetical protein
MRRNILICILSLTFMVGCGSQNDRDAQPMPLYEKALAETDPQRMPRPAGGSEAEKQALDNFSAFYSAFSTETLEDRFDGIYAPGAYFYDGIKEIRGSEAIKTYFRETLAAMQISQISIDDVATSEGNYYLRWTMLFSLKRSPEDQIRALGLTHLRFDDQGRIVFHHDFWDTSVVFERLPVIGAAIRWIKKKI